MKILALNGSRRKNGNTAALVDAVLGAAAADGAATEALFLGDYNIGACTGCEGCSNSWECVIKDDFQPLVARMDAADGVVFASPTYWYSVTSDMKRLIDRCYSLIRFPVSRKEWISKYAGSGRAAVVVAVCEQETEDMMGNTLQLLNDFAGDIGLPVAATVRGLQHFAAGSVLNDADLMRQAEQAGKAIVTQLEAD